MVSLPNRLKRWHQLCLQRCSNTPQKCPRFLGNCAPGRPSETTALTATEWSRPGVTLHLLPSVAYRGVPDVHALIEGAAGQVLPIGAEGYAVHGFLVLGQSVNTHTSLDVPQSHRRVEWGTGEGSQVVINKQRVGGGGAESVILKMSPKRWFSSPKLW